MVFFDFWQEKFEPALKCRDQELCSALCNLRMLAQHVQGSLKAPTELPIFLVRLLQEPLSKDFLITAAV
jgi:hypothetical protein